MGGMGMDGMPGKQLAEGNEKIVEAKRSLSRNQQESQREAERSSRENAVQLGSSERGLDRRAPRSDARTN